MFYTDILQDGASVSTTPVEEKSKLRGAVAKAADEFTCQLNCLSNTRSDRIENL